MDPHSRHNQFNQRGAKSGPPPLSRFVSEMVPKHTLESFTSTPPPPTNKKPRSNVSAPTSSLLIRRPIATNSRIKQNETYRKDMYLAFINNALEQKLNGNLQPFDELVDQFSPKSRTEPLSAGLSTSLRTWILALTHVVSRLERTHSNLVEAIVNMPWTTLDSATVKSYTVFIGMLLSARPEYLSMALGKIVQGFTYQSGLQTLSQAFPESSTRPATRRLIYDRLHYLLQHLLSLIPTLPSTLHPFLARHFPHKRQNQLTQTTYIRNLLRVSSYCPELSEKILATIVERIIQIDVEIQVELEELEQEETPEEQPLFDIDPFDVAIDEEDAESSDLSDADDSNEHYAGDDFSDLSSDAGGGFDDETPLEIPTNVGHIQDMVKKLDSILVLVFTHFQRTLTIISNHPNSVSKSKKASNIAQPSSPPELPLPPLPPLPADSPLPSPATPITTHDYLKETSRRIPSSTGPTMTSITATPPQTIPNIMRTQFNALLSIFDRIILRTFKSRYTQFLIFWFTSLDPEFSDVFQGLLVERALIDSAPPNIRLPGDSFNQDDSLQSETPNLASSTVTRAAASSYIGSFVSRAIFVNAEGAQRVMAVLCEFLNAHLDEVEDSIRTGSTSIVVGGHQHAVFYAVAQAAFLMFCFRWRDLVVGVDEEQQHETTSNGTLVQADGGSGGKTHKWIPELGVLQRVVNSVLNPLRVCSFNVVMQFARVAQATDFIYCYTILESNKRLEHTGVSSSSVSGAPNQSTPTSSTTTLSLNKSESGSVTAELNTFFPFDPYRLPRSAVFIRDIYREWSSVAVDGESDDEESDEDEEIEDETEFRYGASRFSSGDQYLPIPRGNHPGQDGSEDEITGGLGAGLEQMSISPGPL